MSEIPMTPEQQQESRDEVLGEVVAWLVKKAREHRAKGPHFVREADVIGRLADKVRRGAVRPNNLATLPPSPETAGAEEPTPLRWGLDDTEYGDDDSVSLLLSGPSGEPYVLELVADRAAALRDNLAGPDAERNEAGKDTREGESTRVRPVRDGTWYGLPWAAWLSDEDLDEFLPELCSAALDYFREYGQDPADLLRSIEKVCATARLAADADRGQLTAPGPDAEQGDGRG